MNSSASPNPEPKVRERPEILEGRTYKKKTGCGNIYVTVNDFGGPPFEVFVRLGKSGGCSSAYCEAIGRLVSSWLRAGQDVHEVIQQLGGICCHSGHGGQMSCPTAIAEALKEAIGEADQSKHPEPHGDRAGGP